MLCRAHCSHCSTCWLDVCVDCRFLFHSTLTPTRLDHATCGDWPLRTRQLRVSFLARLAKNQSLQKQFAAFLRRKTFVFAERKIYVAITAQQRGDFHKFKWSVSSDEHLVALLPLNESYDVAWFADMVERARALDLLAPEQWHFVHSSMFVSKRRHEADPSEVTRLSGFDSKAFKVKKLGLAELEDSEEVHELFAQWAREDPRKTDNRESEVPRNSEPTNKIYDINSLVPMFNSELTRKTRRNVLSTTKIFGTGPAEPAHHLLGLLAARVVGRDVLVLWGSRTGGDMPYLKDDLPAREFRHKTGKRLVRMICHAVGDRKCRILAGDPLTDIDADIDLTCMWDREVMAKRFGIKYGFPRLEQEYILYHLSSIARNTLHVGMQSGNIETLINNPRSNVVCVNENTRGGAGLTNVDKISARRDELVRRGNLPCNLYMSYNLSVLPSAIGQLTRILMEKYGESVTMRGGIERLLKDLWDDAPSEHGSGMRSSLVELLARRDETPSQGSKPNLLTSAGEDLTEHLLVYLAAKVARRGRGGLGEQRNTRQPPPVVEDMRTEIQLLVALASSTSPRVQYAIRCLNNVRVRPTRSSAEIWLSVIANYVLNHVLYKKKKDDSKGEGGKGALPADPRERAEVLVALMDELTSEYETHREDYEDLQHALDHHAEDHVPKMLKLSVKQQHELRGDRQHDLEGEWQTLRHCQDWEDSELDEMRPICELLEISFESGRRAKPNENEMSRSSRFKLDSNDVLDDRLESRFLRSRSGQVYPLDHGLLEFANQVVPRQQIETWYRQAQRATRPEQLQWIDRVITHLDWQVAELEPDPNERAEFANRVVEYSGSSRDAYQTWRLFCEFVDLRDELVHR